MANAYRFSYKNMLKNAQSTGMSVYGENGVKGKDGVSGSSVYFIDYSYINESTKSIILNRIENSLDLNDPNKSSIRKYRNGDLIICKIAENYANHVYQVVSSDNGSYRFDLINLGTLSSQADNNEIEYEPDEVLTKNVKIGNMKVEKTECFIPTPRSYDIIKSSDSSTYVPLYDDSSANDSSNIIYYSTRYDSSNNPIPMHLSDMMVKYNEALNTLFGISFHPRISLTKIEYAENYNFYLKISLNMSKAILGRNNMPVKKGVSNGFRNSSNRFVLKEPTVNQDNLSLVKFSKILEIPLEKYYNGELKDSSYNDTFISDMSGDKLHPANNNICSFFFDPLRNYGVKQNASLKFADKPGVLYQTYVHFTFDSLYIDYRSLGLDLKDIGPFSNPEHREDHLKLMNKIIRNSTQSLTSYERISDKIQYSQRYNKKYIGANEINFRSGESAYFSSMMQYIPFITPDFKPNLDHNIGAFSNVSIDNYVASQRSLNKNTLKEFNEPENSTMLKRREDKVLECVSDRLTEFIFNENNTYELIIVRKGDGKTLIKSLDFKHLKDSIQ